MADHKSMYYALFNSVTDALQLLMETQKHGEQQYIDSVDAPVIKLVKGDAETKEIDKGD